MNHRIAFTRNPFAYAKGLMEKKCSIARQYRSMMLNLSEGWSGNPLGAKPPRQGIGTMGFNAQITIEAIILVGILILILMGITVPMAFKAQRSATEVSFTSDAKYVSEQIVAAASSISAPGAKRTIVVYVPGATSAKNTTAGTPFVEFTTNLSTDGGNLITTISMVRRNEDGSTFLNEAYTYSSALYGSGWVMYDSAGTATNLIESTGRTYRFTITWESGMLKNITFVPV